MQLRQMLWAPRRVPVCVFEKTRANSLISDRRLIFLGKITLSPMLSIGATGYFAYLANWGRFRSIVLSELKRIMSVAGLDSSYQIENWFMAKDRLIIHVAKNSQKNANQCNLLYSKGRHWLRRRFPGLH
jgi:hypothetical protein